MRYDLAQTILTVLTWSTLLASVHGIAPSTPTNTRPLMRNEASMRKDTISVVLPCLNESSYMIKTVKSFCDRTPSELLEEIVVVDDGSSPPLADMLKDTVDPRCRVRVLRHDKAMGLMVAKQTGGDAAKGKFIGFFDCHVSPSKDWHAQIIQLLREKPRRLVVPQIGDLDLATWDQRVGGALTAKCYMSWNAEFWWYDDDTDFIPAISGGLVATTKDWWQSSGGFEKGMRGWGGENTDQSLRTWLCGGDIVRAKKSIVAHMWRNGDPRTKAHYHVEQVQTDNQARVAAAWYDEFAKVFRNGGLDMHRINVSETMERKLALGCKPFVYFLHRFRKLYREGGMLPDRVFKLRSLSKPQMCMHREGEHYQLRHCEGATWFNEANWIPWNLAMPSALVEKEVHNQTDNTEVVCGNHKALGCAACPRGQGESWCHGDCGWLFGECVPKSLLEKSRHVHHNKCCSGIREWRSLECFDQLSEQGPMAYNCDISGYNVNQQYIFDELGRIRHESGKCITVDAGDERKLAAGDCSSATRWEKFDAFEPEETKMYRLSVEKHHLTDDMPDH